MSGHTRTSGTGGAVPPNHEVGPAEDTRRATRGHVALVTRFHVIVGWHMRFDLLHDLSSNEG